MTLVRDALLAQEIARINDRIEHYAGRVDRGSADTEDVTALALYRQMLIALGELQTPRGRVVAHVPARARRAASTVRARPDHACR